MVLDDVCGGLRNSPSSGKSKHDLKKGPWTTSEDKILAEYVKNHGEGNWNAVQRNSGLMRCGKSCRLRWANHLRPNLKKGAFTPDEENLIVDLHAKLGNKWARMASQLPGRTDNEIKNYWNTRLKRRQRAGLPIYPQQKVLKQEHGDHHHDHHHQQQQQLGSNSSLASRLTSPYRPSNPNRLIFYDAFNPPPSISPNQSKIYGGDGGLDLSPSASASAASNSLNLFLNHGNSNPMPMQPLLGYDNFDYDMIRTDSSMGVLGLPSIQSPAAASSSDDYEAEEGLGGRSSSGLLEDLLGESHALACLDKTEEASVAAEENMHEEGEADFGNHGRGGGDSDNSYEGAPGEGNNPLDYDLLNLLDNFPLSVPIPDWEQAHGSESPMLSNGTNSGTGSQPNGARYNPIAASTGPSANQDLNFDSCLWNNMPSIY
ncbi:hypothetical protein OROMI_019767 [Orobanche minor]